MSVSKHPIALRLERRVGGATKLLATVMALPLIDGIFPALVVAGVLASPTGVIETGILIFGGSATVAVILAEMDGSRREMATSVLLIGAVILPVAALEAALAPTLEGFLNLAIFERFAGLVILAIAAKTASSEIGEYLPSPAVIIGLGLVASFDPSGFSVEVSMEYVVPGTAAAAVGVAFALAVALLSPQLKNRVDIDRFRFGSAVALGVLALPILLRPFGLMQTEAPIALAVLGVTALFAYDPDSGPVDEVGGHDDDPSTGALPVDGDGDRESDDADERVRSADAPASDSPVEPADDARSGAPMPAIGEDVTVMANGGGVADDEESTDPFGDEDSRAPWL
ncbi:DUF5794 domain-containing protein [Halorubrum sp. DTA98]|uniref:DUF5794 domain-containing protein n=1 Tax=Halorubrum sp. DTA98 TaxID=3402163 RepID=UPI003AAACA68